MPSPFCGTLSVMPERTWPLKHFSGRYATIVARVAAGVRGQRCFVPAKLSKKNKRLWYGCVCVTVATSLSTVMVTGNSRSDTGPLTLMSNAAGRFGGAAVSHLGVNQWKRQSCHMVSQKREKQRKNNIYPRHGTAQLEEAPGG